MLFECANPEGSIRNEIPPKKVFASVPSTEYLPHAQNLQPSLSTAWLHSRKSAGLQTLLEFQCIRLARRSL